MKLRHISYYLLIVLFSCMETTLAPDKDCAGRIGGDAVVDDCGHCTGGTTVATFNQYMGCDSACQGSQIDCLGECRGTTITDCNGACGGTDIYNYICEDTDENGFLNIESRSLNCVDANVPGNCAPNFDSCLFNDCNIDTMYVNTVINCQGELPLCDEASGTCINFGDYLEDGTCDFTDTNCEEFEFDGGDCDLVDCTGIHFSEELCIELFDAGCTTGEASWIGDGGCDEGDNDLGLNFNCEKWNYDGGDCESNSRVSKPRYTKKWRD